jgi:dimethylhistidine N-methyltransferase
VAFFPGSSIGNFTPDDACTLLKEVAHLVGSGGNLLVGVDRVKDISILENAYNDSKQVTAAFNLNLLKRLNTELDANFEVNNFHHNAFFNEQLSRIEMHLISNKDQYVTVANKTFFFAEGESLHTENSYKYSYQAFLDLAAKAGFKCRQHWTDENQWFSVFLLEVE